MRTKAEMLSELDLMLMNVLAAKAKGANHPHLTRTLGSADGYMKALLDAGIATQSELLVLVARVRAALGGPALMETPGRADVAA
jgi:hypothetical protein